MKIILTIFFLWSVAYGQTLVGYLKNSGSFTSTACIDISPCNVAAYISGRSFKQVGIGDVITNSGGTPLNGGSTWWGYSAVNGGTSSYRGYKIDGSGVVLQIAVPASTIGGNPNPNAMMPLTFHNNSGAHDCSGNGFTFSIFAPQDDPDIYENSPRYNSNGGGLFTNGTLFTISNVSGGASVWTATYSTTNARMTSVVCCNTNPVTNAGADIMGDLGSSISLNGSANDCNGTIASLAWSQISGPSTATITPSSNSSSIIITSALSNLSVGTYVFRLTATDNSSNSSTDDVLVTVVAAFVGTPAKIPIKHYMVWTFSGDFGRGRKAWMGDTSETAFSLCGHKNGAWLGEAYGLFSGMEDPGNGKFDHDSITPGFQNDDIYPYVSRDFTTPYFVGGRDSQGIVLIMLPRKYDFYDFWWNDSGGVNLSAVAEIMIGTLEDMQKGIFEFDHHLNFGSPAIAYTINQVSTKGWKHYGFLRGSGQYILIRMNNVCGAGGICGSASNSGPGISEYVFDGKPSDDGEIDRRILPWYYYPNEHPPLVRDTTWQRGITNGYVAATGWGTNTRIRDTIWRAPKAGGATVNDSTFNWQGGYLKNFAAASDGNSGNGYEPWVGVMDRDTTAYLGPGVAPMKQLNLNPFQTCADCLPSLWLDNGIHTRSTIKTYAAYIQPNARLLKQTNYASREHVPIDSVGADNRLESSYWRDVDMGILFWAKVGNEMFQNVGLGQYISDARYLSNSFVGSWANDRVQAFIRGNESNIGFRDGTIPNSNFMNPYALRAYHNIWYIESKKVFPNTPVYGQGMAAWKVRPFMQAQMLNNIIYKDMNHLLADIWNIHAELNTAMTRDNEPGVTDVLGVRAGFGGFRNEGMKGQTLSDTVALMMNGWYPQTIYSEIAISTNPEYKTHQDPGGSDNSLSLHSARPIYNSNTGVVYTPYESQGFMTINVWAHYDGIGGMIAHVQYEFEDAADTMWCSTGVACGSCPAGQTCVNGTCRFKCYPNSDANDGSHNRFSEFYAPFFKGSYFIETEDQLFKRGYRVVWKQSDSVNGQLRYVYRNVYERNKFLTFVQWQDSAKASSPRTFELFADVTTCVNKTPSLYDWTFSGTLEPLTVTGGFVTMVPKPEGNYITFESNGLAAFLDAGPPPSSGGILIRKKIIVNN